MDKLYRMKMSLLSGLLQSIILVLYTAFGDYARAEDPYQAKRDKTSEMMGQFEIKKMFRFVTLFWLMWKWILRSAVFQDIHVMIFIGFGFLMTFLKRYGYSAVGFNLLLAALCIQWAILCQGFFKMSAGKVKIGLKSLMGNF